MWVTNNNKLPFSLLLASGEYEVLGAGESREPMDIHPDKIEEYREKGFSIIPRSTETPKKGSEDDPLDPSEGVTTPEPKTGAGDPISEDPQDPSKDEDPQDLEDPQDPSEDEDPQDPEDQPIEEVRSVGNNNNQRRRRR